jgi:hypothetical protein
MPFKFIRNNIFFVLLSPLDKMNIEEIRKEVLEQIASSNEEIK